MKDSRLVCLLVLCVSVVGPALAAEDDTAVVPGISTPIYDNPVERAQGPFERLVIRNVMMIDGTGAPLRGPYDVVVEGDRITGIQSVGLQGLPADPPGRPAPGDMEIDGAGMTVTPGFINAHAHMGPYSVPTYNMAYIYKLWLAHGITMVRIAGTLRGLDWTVDQARKAASGEIEAPDIQPYAYLYEAMLGDRGPDRVGRWVRGVKEAGAVGLKLHSGSAEVVRAAIEEANALGMGTMMHHAQIFTPQATALDTARWGLGSQEHFWYGLPEALFTDRRIQDYPVHHNYDDEQHRFQGAARIWSQAAPPYSDHWNQVMDELVELDFTITPTFAVKSGTLDVMAARRAEWHDEYTMPWQWEFFRPGRSVHGSFWFDWTSRDEAAAEEDYDLGMEFINEFKNRGGRVVAGEDAGYALCLYGFCYVRELELLQEAGFSALEVIRSATKDGADLLKIGEIVGTIAIGKRADLVLVDGNPLHNLQIYRGTKAVRLNDATGNVERYGGVKWTIKAGVVYDAEALLEDVRTMVREAKKRERIPPGPMEWVTGEE